MGLIETLLSSMAGGAVIVAIIRLLDKALQRRSDSKDKEKEIDKTIETKKIDQDQDAFSHVISRLEKVETRVSELQDKLADEMRKNAKLEAENEALKKDNARQQQEIEYLRRRIRELSEKLDQTTATLTKLRIGLEHRNVE